MKKEKKEYLAPACSVVVLSESLCKLVTLSASNSDGHEGFSNYEGDPSEQEGFGESASDPDLTWN